MKTLRTLLVILTFFSCQKELSFEGDEPSTASYPYGSDEPTVQTLEGDTVLAVINEPYQGNYDMDFYEFQGPCTITVLNYDETKWPCALLLKEYEETSGTTPIQISYTHQLIISKAGKRRVSVQKADEVCPDIVPYKIVRKL